VEHLGKMRSLVERQEQHAMRPVIVTNKGYLRGGFFFGRREARLVKEHEFCELFRKQHLRFAANTAMKRAFIHEREVEGKTVRGVKLVLEPEQVLANLGTTKSMKRLTDATLEKYGVTFRRIVSYLRKKRGYAASINEITDYWEKQGVISKEDKPLFSKACTILQRCDLAGEIALVEPSERDTSRVKIRAELAKFVLDEKHGGVVLDEEIRAHFRRFVKENGIRGVNGESLTHPLTELREAGIIAGETELIARGLKSDSNKAIHVGRLVFASLFYREPRPPESLYDILELIAKAEVESKKGRVMRGQSV